MTIHIHTRHFHALNLSLPEYLVLIAHETPRVDISDLIHVTKLSERTVGRIRAYLINEGYLEPDSGVRQSRYVLTDKAYPQT